ncbi:hypothetical protein BJ742DRAFT_868735 [Cladochytrium replicatum]|nr:hypothetical protein BJ742DRAFT_868735 [Cladochytrium replicatum]
MTTSPYTLAINEATSNLSFSTSEERSTTHIMTTDSLMQAADIMHASVSEVLTSDLAVTKFPTVSMENFGSFSEFANNANFAVPTQTTSDTHELFASSLAEVELGKRAEVAMEESGDHCGDDPLLNAVVSLEETVDGLGELMDGERMDMPSEGNESYGDRDYSVDNLGEIGTPLLDTNGEQAFVQHGEANGNQWEGIADSIGNEGDGISSKILGPFVRKGGRRYRPGPITGRNFTAYWEYFCDRCDQEEIPIEEQRQNFARRPHGWRCGKHSSRVLSKHCIVEGCPFPRVLSTSSFSQHIAKYHPEMGAKHASTEPQRRSSRHQQNSQPAEVTEAGITWYENLPEPSSSQADSEEIPAPTGQASELYRKIQFTIETGRPKPVNHRQLTPAAAAAGKKPTRSAAAAAKAAITQNFGSHEPPASSSTTSEKPPEVEPKVDGSAEAVRDHQSPPTRKRTRASFEAQSADGTGEGISEGTDPGAEASHDTSNDVPHASSSQNGAFREKSHTSTKHRKSSNGHSSKSSGMIYYPETRGGGYWTTGYYPGAFGVLAAPAHSVAPSGPENGPWDAAAYTNGTFAGGPPPMGYVLLEPESLPLYRAPASGSRVKSSSKYSTGARPSLNGSEDGSAQHSSKRSRTMPEDSKTRPAEDVAQSPAPTTVVKVNLSYKGNVLLTNVVVDKMVTFNELVENAMGGAPRPDPLLFALRIRSMPSELDAGGSHSFLPTQKVREALGLVAGEVGEVLSCKPESKTWDLEFSFDPLPKFEF